MFRVPIALFWYSAEVRDGHNCEKSRLTKPITTLSFHGVPQLELNTPEHPMALYMLDHQSHDTE